MTADFRSWGAIAIALVLSVIPVYIFLVSTGTSEPIWFGELSPVELATAALYLVGAAIAIYAAFRNRRLRRWFFIVWAGFCILFFGEESSWLQAYLHYQTPEFVAEENVQGEFNLHNLEFVEADQGDRLGDDLGNLLNPKTLFGSDRLFQYFFILWFAVYPVLCRYGPFAPFAERHRLPYPGRRLLVFVWFPVLLCSVFIFASSGLRAHGLNETREMFYSLAIAAFIWTAGRPFASRAAAPTSAVPA